MALVNKLKSIGDAIRNKNGSTDKLTLVGMVDAINNMASVTIDGVKVTGTLNLLKDYLNVNSKISTLPYDFYASSAVVLNGEIHILGGSSSYYKKHYKWNGTSWVSVSTLPYYVGNSSAVVLNDIIHILGGNYSDSCYRYHYSLNQKIYREVA